MQSIRKKFSGKLLHCSRILLAWLCIIPFTAKAQEQEEPLILETIVQNYYNDEYAYVYKQSDKVYLSLPQMAGFVGLKYKIDEHLVKVWYANKPNELYQIDFDEKRVLTPSSNYVILKQDYKVIDNTLFFTQDFWERFIRAKVSVDYLDMTLKLDRAEDFPLTARRKANENRKKGIYDNRPRPFSEYEFDNRMLGTPVVDLSLSKGYSKYDGYTGNTDAYAVNLAMLAGGLDIDAYASGEISSSDNRQIRITGSRTFLGEPGNMFNLRSLEIGDISGLSTSYFTNSTYGRGATFSSFKNLVMSADKTIDITGPLTEGWQVELYWNNQLVGYRQNGTNGRYNFPNMPVSYGLNTFKLVFYGPYGETRTEYERYYSGKSPVKKGEFGYNISAYQPYKSLIDTEDKDSALFVKTKNVVDLIGYYGLTDRMTLMGGYTATPSDDFKQDLQFAMGGVQYAVEGSSVQYNWEQNLDNNNIGHHFEWQGDIFIGQIYAGYDKYNNIQSPLSAYGQDYIDQETEFRLTGNLPFNIPYYLNYKIGKMENDDEKYNSISARISKYLINGLNLSIEDNYTNYLRSGSENDIRLGVYKWWNDWSSESYLTIETRPEREIKEFTTRLDYRTGRNTYLSGEYAHNFDIDMDYFRLSGGQVFDFGGLTATFETDRDLNLSTYLTYNVSFSKAPNEYDLILTGNSKLSQTGTVYVRLFDEKGEPLEGVGVNANGLEKQVYTNEKGVALLTDLQTYEKTSITIDMETLPDISLMPEESEKRIILHPGTIRNIDIPFKHYGAIEGVLENKKGQKMFGYLVSVITANKEEISTYADVEGYFILDNIPYGTYDLFVSKDGVKLAEQKQVKVDDIVTYIKDTIKLRDVDPALFLSRKQNEKMGKIFSEQLDKMEKEKIAEQKRIEAKKKAEEKKRMEEQRKAEARKRLEEQRKAREQKKAEQEKLKQQKLQQQAQQQAELKSEEKEEMSILDGVATYISLTRRDLNKGNVAAQTLSGKKKQTAQTTPQTQNADDETMQLFINWIDILLDKKLE